MDKEDIVPTYNGILPNSKKEWNNAICSNMDGPKDYHTKWIKSEKERQIPYGIPYMWNLKKKKHKKRYKGTYIQNRNKPTDFEKKEKLTVTKVGREGQIRRLGLTYTHYYI